MRKLFKSLTLVGLAVVLCTPNADAQLGGLLKDAAKKGLKKGIQKSVEKKAEQVAEQEMNKQLDKVLPTEEQTNSNSNANGGMSPLEARLMAAAGINTNVNYEKNFSFESEMVMEVEEIVPGQETKRSTYKSYFSKNAKDYAMDFINPETNDRGLIIFDSKNGQMLILSDEQGKKSGMAMSLGIPDSVAAEMNQATQNEDIDEVTDEQIAMYSGYKATGRTKNIAGYTCKEYSLERETGRLDVWATRDVKYDYSNAYNFMGGMQVMATGGSTILMGTVMEMNFFDKQTSGESRFYVKELNMNRSNSLDISGYQVLGMGIPPAATEPEPQE